MKYLAFLIFLPILSFADCDYHINKDSVSFKWTGFKFNEKIPVSGSFDKIDFNYEKATTIDSLIESIDFTIDTSSINSGNLERDSRLKKYVFHLLKIPNTIKGEVLTHQDGAALTKLELNNEQKISFETVYFNETLEYRAKGKIDLLKVGMGKNYDLIHKACEVLHTGADGVAKTWSEVEVVIEADIVKNCSLADKVKEFLFGEKQ